jgi:hypothetical protein
LDFIKIKTLAGIREVAPFFKGLLGLKSQLVRFIFRDAQRFRINARLKFDAGADGVCHHGARDAGGVGVIPVQITTALP